MGALHVAMAAVFTTAGNCTMSRLRAATSGAPRTRTRFALKSASGRASGLRSPCSAAAVMPARFSFSVPGSAPYRLATKVRTWTHLWVSRNWRSSIVRLLASTSMARWTMRFAEGLAPASMGTRAGRTPRSAAPPRDSCARRLLVPLPGVRYLLSAGPPIRTPGRAVSARPSSRHWRAFRLLGRAQLPTPPVGWPTHNFSATGLGAAPPESGNSRRPVQEHALRGDHQQGNSLAGWGAVARGCAKIGPPTRHVTLRDAQGHSETGSPVPQLLAFAAVSFTASAGKSTTKHTGSSSFPGTFTRSYFTITLPGAPSRVFSGMR